jgi:hypothetical protein
MIQIRITSISGGVLPINVYVADVYGNNTSFIGTISSSVPPTVSFNSQIPSIFDTAPEIMLILTDSSGCEVFQILDCSFGCSFSIIIDME